MDTIRDDSLDLSAFIVHNDDQGTPNTTIIKTPLQLAQEEKESGLVITNDMISEAASDSVLKQKGLTEATLSDVNRKLDEMDEMIEKAQNLRINKVPNTPEEKAALIDALEDISIEDIRHAQESAGSENIIRKNGGSAIGIDINSNVSLSEDGSSQSLGNGLFQLKDQSAVEAEEVVESNTSVKRTESSEFTRDGSIQIIIDKTGIGSDGITFTDEEKEKLTTSTRIDLIEVEDMELKTIDIAEPDSGFLSRIENDLVQVLGTACTMPLVGSRYRAAFRGLRYGEYANLALSTQLLETDQLRTRLSVFYDSMVSCSIGTFENFDDFLKHTAMIDLPMMTLAVYVATNPEVMEVGVKCQVKGCGKSFSVKFVPRTLLDLTKVSDRFLEIMEQVSTVEAGIPAKNLHEKSTLLNKKRILLPRSGIICDVGMISCYEMLYNRVPFLKNIEDTMAKKYPNDINEIHGMIPLLAETVSAIYIKDGSKHIKITDLVTISDILFNIPADDFNILHSISIQTNEDYKYDFSVRDVVCPGCGTHTNSVTINLDEEVFLQLQTQRSTMINPERLPRL